MRDKKNEMVTGEGKKKEGNFGRWCPVEGRPNQQPPPPRTAVTYLGQSCLGSLSLLLVADFGQSNLGQSILAKIHGSWSVV